MGERTETHQLRPASREEPPSPRPTASFHAVAEVRGAELRTPREQKRRGAATAPWAVPSGHPPLVLV